MAEYEVGSVSPGANSAEIWRLDGSGQHSERITIGSLDTSSTNRTLDFEIRGDNVIVTDHFDSSYKRTYYVGDAGHNDYVDPM